MTWMVLVQMKGSSTPIYSQAYSSREEAEAELAKIAAAGSGRPDVTWMTARGVDILSAHIIEESTPMVA